MGAASSLGVSLLKLPLSGPSRTCRGAGVLLGLALLLVGQPARAWSPACESTVRYTLPNGIEVVLARDARLPAVALVSSIHAGFRYDPPGHEGLAHYVEHLTFSGSSAFASSFDLYQDIGATGVNATTSADTTDYQAVVPAAQLERAIWIEARRLALGVNVPTEEQAAREREVLLREHAFRYGWAPAYTLLKTTYAELYPQGHPYHASFASPDSLEQLTLGDARWFFAEHYRPEHTRVVLVGDFVPESAKALVEKHLGAIARSAAPPPLGAAVDGDACRWAKQPRDGKGARIVQHTLRTNERLELIWPVGPEEDVAALGAAFGSLGGQLAEAMRQTGLSHQVHAQLVELELGGHWLMRIDVTPGQPFEKVEPLVARVLELARSGAAGAEDTMAQRQAFELHDQLARERLLARALGLARRTCSASACTKASEPGGAASTRGFERFTLESALVIEQRYSVGASTSGDLEVVR